MTRAQQEGLRERLYEICPEMEDLGIYPIVTNKGNRL